jgi:hypothetical protein
MKTRFERPMSVTERIWLGINRAFSPFANQVVVEGRGTIDVARLKIAVEQASESNPGSRLVAQGLLRGCRWVDSGTTPPLRIVKGSSWDGTGPDGAPFLLGRLPDSGPTCDVVYEEGDLTRVIFRSNHGVMDGVGTLTWAEDVFRILRGEQPIGSASTLTEYQLIRSVTTETQKMSPVDSIAPTGKEWKNAVGVYWKRLTFHGQHSKLMGKIAIALAQSAWRHQDGVVRIGIPVDVRPRMPGLRSTGNLTIAIYVEVTKDTTPDSLAAEVRRQLDAKYDCISVEGGDYLDLAPLWLLGFALKMLIKIPMMKGRHNVSGMISNLGLIDTKKYSGGGFPSDTVFLIPPRFDGLVSFVVLTGTKDRVEMMLSVPKAMGGNGRFESLLEDISKSLA